MRHSSSTLLCSSEAKQPVNICVQVELTPEQNTLFSELSELRSQILPKVISKVISNVILSKVRYSPK